LIKVNKNEALMIREVFPVGVTLHRTCKQKSDRHNYYMSSQVPAIAAVEEYRNGATVEELKAKYKNAKIGLYF